MDPAFQRRRHTNPNVRTRAECPAHAVRFLLMCGNSCSRLKKYRAPTSARSFDGLNNPQNLALSFQYAKGRRNDRSGSALSITYSPIHTVDYYVDLADQFIELGAEEICIKDMAGIGRPVSIGKMVKGIKERHPEYARPVSRSFDTGLLRCFVSGGGPEWSRYY